VIKIGISGKFQGKLVLRFKRFHGAGEENSSATEERRDRKTRLISWNAPQHFV
jgi:hypothetical protein